MCEIETADNSKSSKVAEWLTAGRFALLLGLLVVVTFPNILLAGRSFVSRDFGLFSLPLAYFHRESFWHGEFFPLWNPYSSCGIPFLAQWNTITLYPPSLIYLLLPFPWSLSFFSLVHLFWGGLGMYFLAHRWTAHRWGAAVAGILFAFNGVTLYSVMWASQIATWSWVPWVVWLTQHAWQEGGRKVLWATLAGVLQMLAGGPETIVLTWLILFVMALQECIATPRRGAFPRVVEKAQTPQQGNEVPLAGSFRVSGKEGNSMPQPGGVTLWSRFFGVAILVSLVCAAQLLPFLELLKYSNRVEARDAGTWSMPLRGLANFLVPLFCSSKTPQAEVFLNGQSWISSYYPGIAAVWLGGVAIVRCRKGQVWFLALGTITGLWLALGDAGFLYRGVRALLPLVGLARYPVKFVLLVLAATPLLAAFGLKILTSCERRGRAYEWGSALVLVLMAGGIMVSDRLSTKDLWSTSWHEVWQNGLMRILFFAVVFILTGRLSYYRSRAQLFSGVALLVILWLDLATHLPPNPTAPASACSAGLARSSLNWKAEPSLGGARASVAAPAMRVFQHYVHPNPSPEEAYLVSRLGMLPNCNLLDSVPMTDGFFALTPKEINEVTHLGYASTNEDLSRLFDFMCVSKTTAPGRMFDWVERPTALPLVTAGQKPAFTDRRKTLAGLTETNTDFSRMVFLPEEARCDILVQQGGCAKVLASKFTPCRVSVQTEATAASMVVISQTYYPAWRGYVDGEQVKVWRANYAFQAIQVPSGRHLVELKYEDGATPLGAVLSGLGLAACAAIWLKTKRKSSFLENSLH